MSRKRIKRPLMIVFPALVFTLLYATIFIHTRLAPQEAAGVDTTLAFAHSLFFTFAYAWALFYTLRFSKWLFAFALPLLFLTGALATYYVHFYRVDLSADTIAVLFETEPAISMGFITLKLVMWMALSLVISGALVWLCLTRELHDPKEKMVLLVSGAFVFSAFFLDGGISRQYLPYNYLLATADYIGSVQGAKPQKRQIEYEKYTQSLSLPEDLVVVLMVGESLRPDHLSLNGYERETTPLLARRSNLYSFPDVPSCGPFTRDAVPCVLTRASYKAPEESRKETSLISIFRRQGFSTIWIDMQGATSSVFDTSVTALIDEAEYNVIFNTDPLLPYKPDDTILPLLDNALKDYPGRTLIVTHMMGSHWPYAMRYPEAFARFTPTCSETTPLIGDMRMTSDMAACDNAALINAYDNTVLYTDYVLDETMKRLEGRPALVLFTSDHGQSLGEGGYFLHGHSAALQEGGPVMERRAPVIVWMSDAFVQRFPAQADAVARRRASGESITHDFVFHTLLDCVGLQNAEIVNPTLSLCH